MSKILLFNIYNDGITVGSLVLKAQGQHYRITGLLGVLPLAADTQQFIRSVTAGATPHSFFTLADVNGRKHELELCYRVCIVYLKLWLKTVDAGKVSVFDWAGGFDVFCAGFQII
ncbi:hypothetical protein [Pedobacter heparinus]|uniref:hypothetical protein n=1 Tax=Pedobacter heparinus TaxID=984 RepID=UPI00292F75D5|nr:hypothetical protein [Pedobacter heparinus]